MALVATTLSKGYQPELTILFALSEIVSNAYDGEARGLGGAGKMSLAYSKATKKLTVTNAKTVIPGSALLLGTSESRGRDECIGTFGEGLPMALLILARNRYAVTLYNGIEKWEPCIQAHPDFGEDVLCIKTRQLPKSREDFVVEVDHIDEEDWNDLKKKFLKLDTDYEPDLTIKANTGERVLLQPQYKGKVYNKGVFVQERDKLLFGYDLNTTLNRDRSLISDYTLQNELGSILKSAVSNDRERFLPILEHAMFGDEDSLEAQDQYSIITYDAGIKAHFVKQFIDRYGAAALPLLKQDEVEEAERLGRRGIVCSPLLHKLVADKFDSLIGLKGAKATEIKQKYPVVSLTDQECATLVRINDSLGTLGVGAFVQIVEFGSVSTLSKTIGTNIYVSRPLLADPPKLLVQVIREVVVAKFLPDEVTYDVAGDVSRMLAKLYLKGREGA